MSTLLAIPEVREWSLTWTPDALEHLAMSKKRSLADLTGHELMTLLYALDQRYPEECRRVCRAILDGLSAERLAEIQEQYQLNLLLEEVRRRRVRSAALS